MMMLAVMKQADSDGSEFFRTRPYAIIRSSWLAMFLQSSVALTT